LQSQILTEKDKNLEKFVFPPKIVGRF